VAISKQQTDENLHRILDHWADSDPSLRPEIEQTIRDIFEEQLAILVLDMSGFSSSVVRHGITHFLARVSQMRAVAVPAIQEVGGQVVKYIADDVLAVFDSTDDALAAALKIRCHTQAETGVVQMDMSFKVSIGIGWGPTLHVPKTDLWGDQVNQAFKLGEDTAGPGEIMLTEAAWDALTDKPEGATKLDIRISGVVVPSYLLPSE
jgi:class 3 adenylate cyclase